MGQKVNPKGYRVGVIRDWDSKWFADKKDFSDLLVEDVKIREFIKKQAFEAGIADIEIERAVNNLKITIFTGKPGMVIGRGGAGVEELKQRSYYKGIKQKNSIFLFYSLLDEDGKTSFNSSYLITSSDSIESGRIEYKLVNKINRKIRRHLRKCRK